MKYFTKTKNKKFKIYSTRNTVFFHSLFLVDNVLKPAFSVVIIGIIICLGFCNVSTAATSTPIRIESIQVAPPSIAPGQYPNISAIIRGEGNQTIIVNIIAVVTQPDHLVKSWQWQKFAITPGKKESISIPKEYSTRLAGTYKVEFVIYSADMSRRIHALSRTFTVGETVSPPATRPQQQSIMQKKEEATRQPYERHYFGIGAYGNTLNPAGGGTVILWPFRNLGLQGIYTVGTFTSYEGRLIYRYETGSWLNPYAGVGYINVSKKADVIGVETEFKDSTISGVLGVEVLLGKNFRGYLEAAGSNIDLQKDVTNGFESAHATVKYIPVTIGIGLVVSVF